MSIRFEDFKLRIFRAIFLTAVTFVTTSLCATNYYVKVTGSGSYDGDDWDNAMDNRRFAEKLLTAAPGDEFRLAGGVYFPYFDVAGNEPEILRNRTFLIRDGVSIRGGYDAAGKPMSGNFDIVVSAVQLNGASPDGALGVNSCHVVTIDGNASNASSPMLSHLSITGGYATGGGNNSRGAGIFVGADAGANRTIEFSHIWVFGNYSNSDGSGIYISNKARVSIDSADISYNKHFAPYDVWGGGISVVRGYLNISNSRIHENTAGRGGAIHVIAGELVSSGCFYGNNSAGSHGGAIDLYERSKAVFTFDTITNNKSGEGGGGIHDESRSDITLKGCVLKHNAANEGAGIYNSGDSNIGIDSCVIEKNVARQRGGGIDNRGNMTVAHSRITGNSVDAGEATGGGVNQRGTLTVNQCEISYNTAKKGAGIYTERNVVRIANTTISNNTATERGGGICQQYDRCELNFVTVAANKAPAGRGSGIMAHSRPTILNSIISGNSNDDNISGVNLFETGDGCSTHNIIGSGYYPKGSRTGTDVAFDPAIHFGALTFNRDGNTKTHALTRKDPSTNSPAAGKAVFDPDCERDQTGFVRNRRYPSTGAYDGLFFKAMDDRGSVTGSPPVISIDILENDSYPEGCNPKVTLLKTSSPDALQIMYIDGVFVYVAKNSEKGFDTIRYRIECDGGYVDEASIFIEKGVVHTDRPHNIKDEVTCMIDMPAVEFNVRRKIFNDSIQLDGFSIPLVGDLNGDGKPEIVALGAVHNNGGKITWLEAVGTSIVIFDGQTGNIILKFDLSSLGENKFDSKSGYGTKFGFQLRYNPRHNSYSHLAIANLENDKTGEIIVAETGSGKVYTLRPVLDGADRIIDLELFWEAGVLHKHPFDPKEYGDSDIRDFGSPVPFVSDLNGDGIPEVIVYNKIYNGQTGDLELELETLKQFNDPGQNGNSYDECKNSAYVGRIAGASDYDDCMPAMAINDIDGDGIMEIIAGSKIYKPQITDVRFAHKNSFSVINGPESVVISNKPNDKPYYLTDGFTVVADIDGDDVSDVIVVKRHTGRNSLLIYVWDPRLTGNNSLKAYLTVSQQANEGHFSIPFVGDINGLEDGWDGKDYTVKLPEICMTVGKLKKDYAIPEHSLSKFPDYTGGDYTGNDGTTLTFQGHVVAFTYDASTEDRSQRLKLSWMMKHSDGSHQTGIVMFDFDADGVNELVYRDELSLRVISPASKIDGYDFVNLKMDHNNHSDIIRFRETGIASYTGYECPVIADVNGDGSADIVTLAHKSSVRVANSSGYLFVYEADGTSWAPARPVWNQGIYYPLQINDDLTVPRRPQSTLTKYYSKPPLEDKVSIIRPFNGNWIQQPVVRTNNYVPVLMLADPSIQMEDIKIISSSQSETEIMITVENRGEASANSMTPVSFYHTSVNSANKIPGAPLTLNRDIYPGERVELKYTLKGDHREKIICVRLVDDGSQTFPAKGYIDCDESNNEAYTMMIDATDDCFVYSNGNTVYPDICKNDIYNKNAALQIEIIESSRHGVSFIAPGSTIGYLPDKSFTGVDTVRYRISCSDGDVVVRDEATVYILVLEPGSYEYIACPGADIFPELSPVPGVNYSWYDREKGGSVLDNGTNVSKFRFIKGNTDEALWVQMSVTGFEDGAFPRFRINLPLPDNCNSDNPSACAVNGTLLFREDFGGNSPDGAASGNPGQFYECQLDDLYEGSTLNISAWIASISKNAMTGKAQLLFVIEDLDGNTLSKYYTGELPDGVAALKNYGFSFTVPNKTSSVVVRIVNDGKGSSENSFVIDDFAIYLCVPEAGFTDNGNHEICIGENHDFKCTFTDDGSFGNDLEYRVEFKRKGGKIWNTVKTGTSSTGTVDEVVSVTVDDDGYYRLIVGNSDVINCTNCVAVSDEIFRKVKDCTVGVKIEDIEGDTLVCLNQAIDLKFKYSNTSSRYGSDIFYRWEFKHIDGNRWKILEEKNATIPIDVKWSIAGVTKSNEGFYRIRIGKSGSAGTANCCTVSDSIRLIIADVVKVPDIRIHISPMPDRTVHLTSFTDSIPHTNIRWERIAMYSPAIVAGTDKTTGSINTRDFVNSNTYTYKYISTSQCGSTEARVYIRTVKDRIFRTADTVKICRDNESNKTLNLNHILGVEFGGDWKYDATVNPDATVVPNVTMKSSTSQYAGARIFDAVNAYNTAPASYSYVYNGHTNAKIFKFEYHPSNGSNIVAKKKLVIVVTL